MNTLNVLIVDSEEGIRNEIKRILDNFKVSFPFTEEEFNFNTQEAESGEVALELINKSEPDLILLDNKLPGMDGFDVLEYINHKRLKSGVMMISSYASLDLAVKATNYGAYNFIQKPFTPKELKPAIENITKHLYLKEMTEKLNKSGKQVRFKFLSVLSHELKSPLNAIEGYLRIISEKQAGDNINDYQHMLDRSLIRIKGMRGLIMDLLDLTKLEEGNKQRHLEKVDIVQIAKIAKDSIEPMAVQKNISVRMFTDDSLILIADPSEIEIIFNNLISNAVKYNINNGQVDIIIKQEHQKAHIQVKDTGIGLEKEDIKKLFGEFVRIRNIKTKDISGSGLGLSIVKKMVELYQGEIHVESSLNKGSAFKIEIPIRGL